MTSNDRGNEEKLTAKSGKGEIEYVGKSVRKACKRGLTGNVKKGKGRQGKGATAMARLLLTSVFDQRAWKQEQIQLHPRFNIARLVRSRGEGSASGKHPINKGRFYTRSSLLERKTKRVGARIHAREEEGECRGLRIRG